MFPGMKLYYHMYNYHLNHTLKSYNMCLNFL